MISTRIAAVVAVALLAACASTPPAERAATPAPVEKPQAEEADVHPELANEPVLLPVPADPTVSFRIAFLTGSQDDPEGKEGLAYLTASLMAEGATEAHAYAEILDLLYPMAASYGVRVDKEMTTFAGRVHTDNLDAYTELFLDAVLHPAFSDDDLERLRSRTIDEIENTLRYASDEELGKAVLYTEVFAGTPYGHLDRGTVEGLKSITVDDVRAFYESHFTGDRVIVGIGGGYDDALVDTVTSALSALPTSRLRELGPPEPEPIDGRQVVLVSKSGQATAISFGYPIDVHRGERDFYALWIANSWLGEHRNSSSHLYQVIREARGLNYGDYSYIEHFPEGGRRQMPPSNVPRDVQLFEVWIRPVPNEAAHFALRAAVREIDRLVADGMSEESFELTTQFLRKYSLHFADNTMGRLGYAIDDRFYGIEPEGHLARFRRMMDELTLDDVNTAIRKYLQTDDMLIAMVAPEADALAEALAADTASPITYQTEKPAEVIAEDEAISTYPLGIEADAITVVPVEKLFVDAPEGRR